MNDKYIVPDDVICKELENNGIGYDEPVGAFRVGLYYAVEHFLPAGVITLSNLKSILEEIRDNEYTFPSSYWQLADQGLEIVNKELGIPDGKKCDGCNAYKTIQFTLCSCDICKKTIMLCKDCIDVNDKIYKDDPQFHCNKCMDKIVEEMRNSITR